MSRLAGFAAFCGLSASCGAPYVATGTDSGTDTTGSSTDDTSGGSETGTTAESDTETTETTGDPGDPALTWGPLAAGVAVGYAPGPVGISMAGYGGRTVKINSPWNDKLNACRGFYGYPTVKAMVLDVDGERLALVKLPTMSSEHSLTEAITQKLKDDHGLDFTGRILTGATHSHHTQARYWRLPPALAVVGADSPDEELIDRLATVFADTIQAAVDDLGPAEWGFGYQEDWDPDNLVHRDRRGENNPTYGKDARLSMLAVRRPNGAPMAAILNFGMHGTVFDSPNELLTEDAPGGLEMKFEEYFYQAEGAPIFGMFIQSGGGDSSPAGDRLGHPGPARIELLGTDAAPRLYALYQDLEWRDEAAIEVRSRRVDLNYAALGYEDSEEFKSGSGLPYIWGAWQCNVGQGDDANPATSSEGKPKSCADVKQLLETLDEPIPHPEMHQTLLTAAMFGEVALITLPGEPTYSVIKYLRDQVATREVDGAPVEVLAFGYSQDHLLYLTHPDDWFQGGYESEMSLWGPFAAKFFVDRQMATLDTILAGEDGPVFAEESPPLGSPGTFTPRGYERSTNPGDVIAEAPGKLERGQTARFSWGGGDPSLGSPYVVVEVDQGNGEFAPQPSPSGWPGTYLDNTRYHMITRVAPDPAPNGKVLDERAHVWMVDWQIPLDFPAGYARLRATGSYWDGAAPASYEVVSAPIYVRGVDGGALEATPAGDELELRLTAPGVPFVGDDKYPEGGFRLLDPTVGPSDTLTTRAPLRVWFTQDGEAVGQELTVSFDAARGAHVLTLADAGVPDGALTVHAHLEADIEPHVYTAPVN